MLLVQLNLHVKYAQASMPALFIYAILAVVAATSISKHRVALMLVVLRRCMAREALPIFSGTVELDETYIGGQRKNARLHIPRIKGKRGHGTDKLPIFGIFHR